MSTVTVSPLRQRMIEDMNARKLCAETQRGHIRSCRRFAAFLKQSPDTATAEDIRRFQLHLSETGVSICNLRRAPLAHFQRGYGAGLELKAHPHMLRHACGYALAICNTA
jgi:site-specific recombinase XerD